VLDQGAGMRHSNWRVKLPLMIMLACCVRLPQYIHPLLNGLLSKLANTALRRISARNHNPNLVSSIDQLRRLSVSLRATYASS
jgi:hypothetical protein